MKILHVLAEGLIPSLCAACGRSSRRGAAVCTRCGRRLAAADPLAGAGPPGIDRAWSSAPYEEVARDLVASPKFRRLLPVAGLMADRIL
jgi:predicted amidophosphoribosyltransferase